MKLNKSWVVAVVGVAGLAMVALNGRSIADVGAGAAVCDPQAKAANLTFTVNDMNGKPFKFSSLKGKVVILDFWATWCGPCKVEIPGFVELKTKYKARGLEVVGVSVDDTVEQLRPFAAKYQMNYPVLVGSGNDALQEAFGPIWGLPTTYIIGRDGKLCKKHMGLVSKDQFEKEVLGLL